MFACGFLLYLWRYTPFLIAFQVREAKKDPLLFLVGMFLFLPSSGLAVVGLEPTAITHAHSFHKCSLGVHCLLDTGAVWVRPLASLWDLTASWKRREKIQVNKHRLMRKPVCDELVEESFGQEEQGVLISEVDMVLCILEWKAMGPL